jgi:hypothetical protein
MSTTAKSFFSTDENQIVLRRFSGGLDALPVNFNSVPNFLPHLRQFIVVLLNNSNSFDRLCSVNIEWIGGQFISSIQEFQNSTLDKKSGLLIPIFTMSYRFICELDFSQPDDLGFELRGFKNFVENNLETFPADEKQQLVYANYIMPVNIAKKLIHSPALAEFKAFTETANAAKELKRNWDNELEDKSKEIEALRSGIDRIKTTYNFVGLIQGFEVLATAKKDERRRSFYSLIGLGMLMVIPPVFQVLFTAFNIESINSHKDVLIYSLPPLLALEVILLYLFRVVLLNFRNVTAQLLQINLRMSLCQFIQSYSEYSTKIKKADASALDKFENIIFSGISSNNDTLPSTFDGVESLANLISSIRGGKG